MLPWQCTTVRLPSIFEILVVWPSIFLAVKLCLNKRAAGGVIEWIGRIIINPSPLKQVTAAADIYFSIAMYLVFMKA